MGGVGGQEEAREGQATVGEEMAIDPVRHSTLGGHYGLSAWWSVGKGGVCEKGIPNHHQGISQRIMAIHVGIRGIYHEGMC